VSDKTRDCRIADEGEGHHQNPRCWLISTRKNRAYARSPPRRSANWNFGGGGHNRHRSPVAPQRRHPRCRTWIRSSER